MVARTSSPSRWSRASTRASDRAVVAEPGGRRHGATSDRIGSGARGSRRAPAARVEPASAAHERRNAPSDRASTASSGMRWRTSVVKTPIGVSAGSAMRSSAAHDVDPRIGADRHHQAEALAGIALDRHRGSRADLDPRQQVQRLGGDVGPAQISTVGGHEAGRQPGPVGAVDHAGGDGDRPLERVGGVRAVRHALVEQHDAALQALHAVLADLQRLGARRRPPVDGAGLVAVDVVAQAVEVAGAEPLGQAPAGDARGRPGPSSGMSSE